jgi:hypothetical protein
MKAILEFQLPEDAVEHELALKGTALAAALHDFLYQDLRSVLKYGNCDLDIAHAEKWRNKLIERLEEAGVIHLIEANNRLLIP